MIYRRIAGNGYTIVEMLVVIGVVGLLATIVVVRFSGTNESHKLENAQQVVASDIRSAIAWSQTGKIEQSTGSVPEGYGIVFSPSSTSYSIYAEFSGNQQLDSPSSDVLVKTVDLLLDELIDHVEFSGCVPAVSGTCDLFVESPSGKIYTNGTTVSDLMITFTNVQSMDSGVIKVNIASGQISN